MCSVSYGDISEWNKKIIKNQQRERERERIIYVIINVDFATLTFVYIGEDKKSKFKEIT